MTIASVPLNAQANAVLPVSWRVGEHIACVGDTGSGKTYLVSKLVELRQYVVIFRTKPDDIKFPGFVKAKTAAAMDGFDEKILLTPKYKDQAVEGFAMLEKAWTDHNWTIVIDELWYVERLGLKPYVERLLTQGRSIKVSVVVGMQRPALISRFAISSCTHLFTFQLEGRDIQTVKEATTPRIVPVIEGLRGKDFAYYHRGKRIVATGNARRLDQVISTPAKRLTRA